MGLVNAATIGIFKINLANSYTRSNLTSNGPNGQAGFIGSIIVTGTGTLRFNISNTFSSNYLLGDISIAFGSVGVTGGSLQLTTSDFFYNNQSLPEQAFENTTYSSLVQGLTCPDLYNSLQNFDQLIWGGNSLRSEYNFSSLPSLCDSYSFPSTLIPSTPVPSTDIPSTQTPSTDIPSTEIPSTQISSTQIPSTEVPSTQISSTQITSTNSLSTQISSTFILSTFQNTPSTLLPTSSTTQSNCVYQVPNCQNCDQSINKLEIFNLNVSCVLIGNSWSWVFQSNSSNQILITSNLTINAQISINSDLIVGSNASISIVVSNSSITVNGCVSIEGDLNVLIDFKLDQQQEFELIKYNCSQTADLPKEINVIYQKNQNNCLKSKTKVTQNTISATIDSCGKNVALIIGLSIGLPVAIILITVLGLIIARWKLKKEISQVQQQQKDIELNYVDEKVDDL